MSRYVCDENMCTGCMACKDICSQGAIAVIDSVKHYNAVIDENKCIECGKCGKVCQNASEPVVSKPVIWHQGWSKNQDTHESSTSGGLAAEIEKEFIRNGGAVCSCTFEDGRFKFRVVRSVEEVGIFRGSKYVKSNPTGVYREIKTLLERGEKVLFLGLPCQVAAVKKYCDAPNLYAVDIICHGTPSPSVLEHFLHSSGIDINDVSTISFRVKDYSRISDNAIRFAVPGIRDYYSYCFGKALDYTENCYICRYARLERVSDLTLGDAWGSELPVEVRKKGVSVALCQTPKGEKLLNNENLELMPIDLEKVLKANPQLSHPSKKPENWNSIMNDISNGIKLKKIIRKNYPKLCYKNILKTILNKVGLYPRKKTRMNPIFLTIEKERI